MDTTEKAKEFKYWDGDEIVKGLLLGSVTAVKQERAFNHYGITAVLSILTDAQMALHEDLEKLLESFSVSKKRGNWLRFEFEDSRLQNNVQSELHEAADFIQDHMLKNEESSDDGYVMVHCWAGMSRSPTMVAAFLIKHRSMSCEDALDLINSQRKQACPNSYFHEQLLLFQKNLNSRGCSCAIL